jgi:hypothetical protein
MDAISPSVSNAEKMTNKDVKLLKKSQDLAKQEMAALLSSIPPPPKASPPGMGMGMDVSA